MKFIICDTIRLQNCINHIGNLPLGKYTVEIYETKKKRTNPQSNLWHKWVDMMSNESGNSPAREKDIIKREILGMGEHVDKRTGELSYYDYHTAELTKEQFTRLMTHTQILAMEYYGMTLPTSEDLR